MLREHQIQSVLTLHAAEPRLSQTKLAQRTGVSRASVQRILSTSDLRTPTSDLGNNDDNDDPDAVPSYRCRGCGHTVSYQPCKICQANRILDSTRTLRLESRPRRAA